MFIFFRPCASYLNSHSLLAGNASSTLAKPNVFEIAILKPLVEAEFHCGESWRPWYGQLKYFTVARPTVCADEGVGRPLCYAIIRPGRKSGFRAGFRPDSARESIEIGPPAGQRTDFEALPIHTRPKFGPEARFPARKH